MKTVILLVIGLMFCELARSYELVGQDLMTTQKVHISNDDKKGLVILFLSSKCPCSDSHVEEIKQLAKKYTDFSFVAVHSNVDEERQFSKAYFQRSGISFPVVQDENSKIADQFQALKTPHAFVVLPSGKVAYRGGVSNSNNFSAADRKYLREALEDIHLNRPVSTQEGRTLGCVISRGEKNVW